MELFYWEDCKSADLAVVLDVPHGTVRSRLRRARELLREGVERLADDPELAESTLGNFERWMSSVRRKVDVPNEDDAPPAETEDA